MRRSRAILESELATARVRFNIELTEEARRIRAQMPPAQFTRADVHPPTYGERSVTFWAVPLNLVQCVATVGSEREAMLLREAAKAPQVFDGCGRSLDLGAVAAQR